MRVIRSTYRGAAEWLAQREAVRAARALDGTTGEARGLPSLEPAVVLSGPDEHTEGVGVLVEAVGPDGQALYQRLVLPENRSADSGGTRPEDASRRRSRRRGGDWCGRWARRTGSPRPEVAGICADL